MIGGIQDFFFKNGFCGVKEYSSENSYKIGIFHYVFCKTI
jgi:hypothetical protein